MRKSDVLFLHLSFWMLIGLLLFAILQPILSHTNLVYTEQIRTAMSLLSVIVVGCFTVFYTAYFLAPFFIRRKKRLYSLIAFIFFLAIVYTLKSRYINNNVYYLVNTLGVFIPPLILSFLAFLFRMVIELWKDKLVKTELEKDQLLTQLELLKAKIDPHFLFNSLNNIDVMIEENPRTASTYLNRLSGILRYVLYEAKNDDILLVKELDQIKSYVELQKIRTANTSFVHLSINGDVSEQKIAPMIFIPFIENAFKHCKNKTIENAIQINFDIHPNSIQMTCKNYYDTKQPALLKNDGLGIGIVKQRLNLLYPGTHELIIDQSEPWFAVTLTIKPENGN